MSAIILLIGGLLGEFLGDPLSDEWIEGAAIAVTCFVVTIVAVRK